MNISFFIDFLKHYLTAKTRHGTHSPFVYKLTDEVIYDFNFKDGYNSIELLRKKLYHDDRVIEITDLGAGSQINKNRTKRVSDIARNTLKSPRLAQLLYRLVKNQQPSSIMELGTCLGLTTAYFSLACPDAKVVTIEGCPQTAGVADQNFKELNLPAIDLRVGNFDTLLPELLAAQEKVDVVYIDGNHRKEATLNYFHWCLPKVHEHTLLIFDDIYWSKGMKEAWEEIKAHPQVTVTVDLFWIGLVYFKKGQAKEHFKIRF